LLSLSSFNFKKSKNNDDDDDDYNLISRGRDELYKKKKENGKRATEAFACFLFAACCLYFNLQLTAIKGHSNFFFCYLFYNNQSLVKAIFLKRTNSVIIYSKKVASFT